jgi:hypothetical protein
MLWPERERHGRRWIADRVTADHAPREWTAALPQRAEVPVSAVAHQMGRLTVPQARRPSNGVGRIVPRSPVVSAPEDFPVPRAPNMSHTYTYGAPMIAPLAVLARERIGPGEFLRKPCVQRDLRHRPRGPGACKSCRWDLGSSGHDSGFRPRRLRPSLDPKPPPKGGRVRNFAGRILRFRRFSWRAVSCRKAF